MGRRVGGSTSPGGMDIGATLAGTCTGSASASASSTPVASVQALSLTRVFASTASASAATSPPATAASGEGEREDSSDDVPSYKGVVSEIAANSRSVDMDSALMVELSSCGNVSISKKWLGFP